MRIYYLFQFIIYIYIENREREVNNKNKEKNNKQEANIYKNKTRIIKNIGKFESPTVGTQEAL